MQSNYPRSYSSAQLRPLDLISDQVWLELGANGTFNRPKGPETAHANMTRRVMRYEIGRQVMNYAKNGQMTDREISHAVVKGMSFAYPTLSETAPFRKFGAALPETSARTPTVVRKEIKSHY